MKENKPVRHRVVEEAHVASLGPYCGRVFQVEVALTTLKLTETDGQAGTSKYREA